MYDARDQGLGLGTRDQRLILSLSLGSTSIGAWGRLTVERAGSFNARGDLPAKFFGVAPQPLRLFAEQLQFSQSLFIQREHDTV